jgi:hypothetical protein
VSWNSKKFGEVSPIRKEVTKKEKGTKVKEIKVNSFIHTMVTQGERSQNQINAGCQLFIIQHGERRKTLNKHRKKWWVSQATAKGKGR